MKKHCWQRGGGLIVLSVLLFHYSQAQYVITTQIPSTGVVSKMQLWNFVISNTTTQTKMVRLQLTLQDLQSKQTVLSAVSGSFAVGAGAKVIQYQNIQPVQYNYAGANVDRNPQGLLPVGNFQLCVSLIDQQHAENFELASDCLNIEVEPLSPPVLVSPEDTSMVDYMRPAFTWFPPAPLNMFSNLSYDLILSPVRQGQSVTEAVQYNLPVYSASSLNRSFLQYPAGIPALDSGKTYAWQVIAKSNFTPVAKSEVWSFTCKKDSASTIVDQAPYLKLQQAATSPGFIYQGFLKVEYFHEKQDPTITVEVVSLQHPEQILTSFHMDVVYGKNFLKYDLNPRMRLQEAAGYEARFIADSKTVYTLRFYAKNVK